MEIDETGWRDLDERLEALSAAPAQREILVAHLVDRLIGHFGTDLIECHRGKNDPSRHSMQEVAAAAIVHLAVVLEQLPPDALGELIETGSIGTAVPAPWDDHWRIQERTASWRS